MSSIDASSVSQPQNPGGALARAGRRSIRPAFRLLLVIFLLGLALVVAESFSSFSLRDLSDRAQTFVTIFLGIFIEAVPFLLAGSIVSGLIEVFLDQRQLARFIPRQPILATLAGTVLGLAFPVCECGVVPVTRRLQQKGLPVAVGIAFLLAAPVVNPVVIASTYAAFGWGPVLWGRVGLSLLIAFIVGLLFQWARPDEVLRPEPPDEAESCDHLTGETPRQERFWAALNVAGDDFLDMSRYLIAGSMLAAGMQTLVPQSALLALGQGSVSSVVAMLVFAFVLSVCSTVDAFLALAFVNIFTPASILGFLVFGPMVDIKSSLMFLGVFRRRVVLYLILLPLLLTLLAAVYLNLNVGW